MCLTMLDDDGQPISPYQNLHPLLVAIRTVSDVMAGAGIMERDRLDAISPCDEPARTVGQDHRRFADHGG